MYDIDEKVFSYTADFSKEVEVDVNMEDLRNGVMQHMASARTVVSNRTLERIGYQHLAVMINTAARYDLTLAEVLAEAINAGVQPVSSLCQTVSSRKKGATRKSKRPTLRIV